MDERLKQKFYEGKSREEITELFYDMFYGALSRRVWLTYEEDGAAWLTEALADFGRDRGRELSQGFAQNGLKKTVPNLIRYFDFVLRGGCALERKPKPGMKPGAGPCAESERVSFQLTVKDSPRVADMRRYGTDFCVALYLRTVFPALLSEFSSGIRLEHTEINLAENREESRLCFLLTGPDGEDCADYIRGKEYAASVKDLYDTMYGFIAKTVIEKAGAEGEQIVRRGIRDFGLCRGQRLRRMQEEEGLERNLFNLMDYYDIPAVEGYHEEKEIFTPVKDICNVESCNHFDRWTAKNMLVYGVMYCEEVHNAFWTAYNERIVVQQPEILTRGDSRCRFITKIEE